MRQVGAMRSKWYLQSSGLSHLCVSDKNQRPPKYMPGTSKHSRLLMFSQAEQFLMKSVLESEHQLITNARYKARVDLFAVSRVGWGRVGKNAFDGEADWTTARTRKHAEPVMCVEPQ
jgi:hypothetical protein